MSGSAWRTDVPERFWSLPGERATAGVRDGAGDHHRQARAGLEDLLEREQRRLGVQRVEHGLDHDEIYAAAHECVCRFAVRLHQIREVDVAGTGVAHIGREAGRAVGRPQHAGYPTRPLRCREGVRGAPGDHGGGEVHVRYCVLQGVICLGDARGGERIGLDDVGTRLQIGTVDGFDYIGTSKR